MRTPSWCSQNITFCLHPAVPLSQLGLSSGGKFALTTSAEIICRESRALFLLKGTMLPKLSILLTLNLLSRPWDLMLSDRSKSSAGVAAAEGGGKWATTFGIISAEETWKEGDCFMFVPFLVRVPTSRMNNGIFLTCVPPMADQPLFSIYSIEDERERRPSLWHQRSSPGPSAYTVPSNPSGWLALTTEMSQGYLPSRIRMDPRVSKDGYYRIVLLLSFEILPKKFGEEKNPCKWS